MRRPVLPLAALLLSAMLALSACGRTGPLYLPDKATDTVKSDKKPSSKP